jgi:hypothetical protein
MGKRAKGEMVWGTKIKMRVGEGDRGVGGGRGWCMAMCRSNNIGAR